MDIIQEEKPRNELKPDRYFTPQINDPLESKNPSIYKATPTPGSVVVNSKARVSKNESCCLACLIACFLCCAVKEKEGDT